VPLTPKGREQAEAVGRRLRGRGFARVLTSPLRRAADTCAIAGLAHGAEVDPDLVEWDYGDYEGLTTPEIRRSRPGWLLWRDGCPGGETAADVGRRTDRVVARLRELEGDAAVFGHGHLLRVLAARWIELEPAAGGKLTLSTGALSVLGWERELPAIRSWNAGSTL
jgi:probable phosphoglycerate mutase